MKESGTTTGFVYLTPAIAPAAKFATKGRAEIDNELKVSYHVTRLTLSL
jgi:hypothetical protein